MRKINSLSDLEIKQSGPVFCILDDDVLNHFSEQGVTRNFLKEFEDAFPLFRELLPDLLKLSPEEYKNILASNQSLPKKTAKRLLLITQILFHSYDVFVTERNFFIWLYSTPFVLNQQKPIDLLKTNKGIKEMHILLGRIEHGIPS